MVEGGGYGGRVVPFFNEACLRFLSEMKRAPDHYG